MHRFFGNDITISWDRIADLAHYYIIDHAILRILWTNFDKVDNGVFRSNQPTRWRWMLYQKLGIRAVLNLRGQADTPAYHFEKETLDDLGIPMTNARIFARKTPHKEELLNLINCLKSMPTPFLMHCKSGADRAGLASVLYLHIVKGEPLEIARQHLSWRYLHFSFTKTGIVDHLLDVYEQDTQDNPMSFEDWVKTHYDRDALQAGFAEQNRWPF
ncbi:tyrosine-protein phosphatase [Pseudaestuariivita rosea]|uniref:tyrosine-protein phosphatase n=1 Tax=Pseudaestuariivita rosea TaxID=2763263 RepID=UPI001ABA1E03|nr:tyrosine-protein phosphatase [Pseudaestuariivita rosea]